VYSPAFLDPQVEGSGNGIKTKIPNLLGELLALVMLVWWCWCGDAGVVMLHSPGRADIAKDLHREAGDILKVFGFELGAVTIKNDEANSYIVNGKFSANELAEGLSF
jgi:hypothetical protein